jgi:hypothetical protein
MGDIKKSTSDLMEMKGEIKTLKTDLSEVKKSIGNGGFAGIKGELQEIKIACAEFKTKLERYRG